MKNEKEFKKFITEIAAKIAEEESDDSQSQLPKPTRKDASSYAARKKKSDPFRVEDKYTGVKYIGSTSIDGNLKKQAENIVDKISMEAKDEPKKATITTTKDRVVFRIEFENIEDFVGSVTPDPSDLPKTSSDPDDPAGAYPQLDPKDPKYFSKDDDGKVIQPYRGEPTGYAPNIVGIKSSDPKKKFASLKEILRSEPIVKAFFTSSPTVSPTGKVTSKGIVKNVEDVTFLSSGTKGMIFKFLKDVADKQFNLSRPVDPKAVADFKKKMLKKSKSNVNEASSFEARIYELAAKIAGVNEEYDGSKINLPDSFKTRVNSAVANQKDMAQFILDMMQEIIAGETSMQNIEKMSGWNSISNMLKKLAGEGAAKDDQTPDVAPEDQEKMALPDLKEAYERIKKK